MDGFLGFLSDLILLTFGLAVMLFWLALFVAIGIEAYDMIFNRKSGEVDPPEFPDEDLVI